MRRGLWISMFVGVVALVVIARADTPRRMVGTSGQVDTMREALREVNRKVTAKQAILLDVREQKEWDAGHLELAQLLPSSVLRDRQAGAAAVKGWDKEVPIYLHCQRGVRAAACAKLLSDLGFDARPIRLRYEQMIEGGFKEARPPQKSSRLEPSC